MRRFSRNVAPTGPTLMNELVIGLWAAVAIVAGAVLLLLVERWFQSAVQWWESTATYIRMQERRHARRYRVR